MTPAIEVRDLRFRYPDGTEALRGVNLRVSPGECVGLIGPNGAGKSTLLLHLNGILPERLPADPRVLVGGQGLSPGNLHEIRRQVGYLFQDPNDQLFCPTVYEDVAFGPMQFGLNDAQVRQRVADALAQVGLGGFENRSPHRLSGGEKRLVCLAGILACDPSILILDEPTSNLDPRSKRHLARLLASIRITKIISTHDLELVVQLCERTIVLDKGAVVAEGLTATLLNDEQLMFAHGLERPHILQHVHPHGPIILPPRL